MSSDILGDIGPHPELRELIVTDFNRGQSGTDLPISITQDQIEVLQQRTFTDQSIVQTEEADALTATLLLLHGVPPARSTGVMLHWATLRKNASDWETLSYTAKSFPPGGGPLPFQEVTLAAPVIGLACGMYVTDLSAGIATLRLELADQTVLEDSTGGQSLLVFAPQQGRWAAATGWADEYAPLVRVLDKQNRDTLPPNRLFFP